MRFLLDTNVVSEPRKPAPRRDDWFNAWAGTLSLSYTYLPVITLLEPRAGIESKRRLRSIRDLRLARHEPQSITQRLGDDDAPRSVNGSLHARNLPLTVPDGFFAATWITTPAAATSASARPAQTSRPTVTQRRAERATRKPTSSTRKSGWLRRRTDARQLQRSSNHPPPRNTL